MGEILFNRIKDLCKQRKITMAKLSEDIGISVSLIRKWKSETSPSIDKIIAIAEYFNVSVDYLVGMSDIVGTTEEVLSDQDIVSLQRAKSKMSPKEQARMMNMIRAGFDYAFGDEE